MQLEIRVMDGRSSERVVSVDGAWGQPGLNLSHWPGNTTPRELRHDLSTGIALNFARLSAARRGELAQGCVAIANNHYDTDGVCSVFAVRHPERALDVADELLAAAEAGDLFRVPSERAFQIDRIVTGLADEERSPWKREFAGLDARARHELVLNRLVEGLDELVTGDLDHYADLWSADLERLRADRAVLSRASRDELVHLDLCLWTGLDTAPFAPGRHALFGATRADRVLVLQAQRDGTWARFLVNTTSWFDIQGAPPLQRPDLEALARALNELEDCAADAAVRWHTHPSNSASPELWFGAVGQPWFAEHNDAQRASRLSPGVVRTAVVEALRAVWTFPEDT